jgi:hypothetical protein
MDGDGEDEALAVCRPDLVVDELTKLSDDARDQVLFAPRIALRYAVVLRYVRVDMDDDVSIRLKRLLVPAIFEVPADKIPPAWCMPSLW